MAEGMPYYKPNKKPVESFDESLEEIERQASLLFEEFLRLAEPARPAGPFLYAKSEQSDSPVVRDQKQFKGKLKNLRTEFVMSSDVFDLIRLIRNSKAQCETFGFCSDLAFIADSIR